MNEIRKRFQEDGVSIIPNVWNSSETEEIFKEIIRNIEVCAQELNCGFENYLRNVSRWVHPSPVTESVYNLANIQLKKLASNICEKEVVLVELNVIGKSSYSTGVIPCHQDIPYTPENPYEFSLWLALHDVGIEDGVLECLPRSHLNKIESAVNFWSPDFIDKMYLSNLWQKNFNAFPVKSGDCVILDSRVWHRSEQNKSGRNRFAIVSRWRFLEDRPIYEVPEKQHSKFGIWTCGQATRTLLQQGLEKCFGIVVDSNLETYISLWVEALIHQEKIPFKVDFLKCEAALMDLYILDQAAQRHNGGDAQGTIHAKVWEYLLQPLSIWLEKAHGVVYESL